MAKKARSILARVPRQQAPGHSASVEDLVSPNSRVPRDSETAGAHEQPHRACF